MYVYELINQSITDKQVHSCQQAGDPDLSFVLDINPNPTSSSHNTDFRWDFGYRIKYLMLPPRKSKPSQF